MPPRVAPEARRELIADAVIDEIAEHGLRSVTLARIAARTGLAIGSIRYYFGDTFREVMRFTLGVLIQRIVRRRTTRAADPVSRLVDIISLVAPTTDQERKENSALIEYHVAARTDPEFASEIAKASIQGVEAIRALLRDVLADKDVSEEALRREALLLFTLIEGFSLSSSRLPAPLDESDVRAVAAMTVRRMRDTYAPIDAG
ncbi:TetR/AcrR family transcriptional regulator [Streptomyces anulatus]|uniref:TetR/AcrR family transcriptional regulator n=1 Tax=Streptomyces anulatus TaxID=1892 RepID=UPI001C5FB8C1|nr:TetR/AcrR family transcriptional regulator [Streptomyces anulatus]QYA98326.1 TetR/AcrR family transcriptional regulator [Streptomyces anulatus]